MAGTCEFGNEPSGSIKCGEFLGLLRTDEILKKDSAPWSKPVTDVTQFKINHDEVQSCLVRVK